MDGKLTSKQETFSYLMELGPRYADVIIRRWEELTGEEAVKINYFFLFREEV